jgi:P27 family predicted phage terminase small subunit
MPAKKKPTELKKLEGTYRKDRAIEDEFAPNPIRNTPIAPHFLNQWGLEEWERITPLLIDYNLLTEFDKSMLYNYCNEYGKYIECEIILRQQGRVIKTKTGYPIVNPLESMAQRSLQNAMKIADKFGFTPASRTSISATPKKDKPTGIMTLIKK